MLKNNSPSATQSKTLFDDVIKPGWYERYIIVGCVEWGVLSYWDGERWIDHRCSSIKNNAKSEAMKLLHTKEKHSHE